VQVDRRATVLRRVHSVVLLLIQIPVYFRVNAFAVKCVSPKPRQTRNAGGGTRFAMLRSSHVQSGTSAIILEKQSGCRVAVSRCIGSLVATIDGLVQRHNLILARHDRVIVGRARGESLLSHHLEVGGVARLVDAVAVWRRHA